MSEKIYRITRRFRQMAMAASAAITQAPMANALELNDIDLSTLGFSASSFSGGPFVQDRSSNATLQLFQCPTCSARSEIDIRILPYTPRPGDDYRQGTLTIDDIHDQCQRLNSTCRATALTIGPAVGFREDSQFPGFNRVWIVLFTEASKLQIGIAGAADDVIANSQLALDTIGRALQTND